MRILITNDDGIASPAIPLLIRWAHKRLSAYSPRITVIAPKVEQSGKSQAIEIQKKVEYKQYLPALESFLSADDRPDVEIYSLDSTPADCVRFAVLTSKEKGDEDFDLVISGINRGFNLGNDIAYSGTCGAIFEAARHGINAIAFSSDGFSLSSPRP